jgi:hypothetical protein
MREGRDRRERIRNGRRRSSWEVEKKLKEEDKEIEEEEASYGRIEDMQSVERKKTILLKEEQVQYWPGILL